MGAGDWVALGELVAVEPELIDDDRVVMSAKVEVYLRVCCLVASTCLG